MADKLITRQVLNGPIDSVNVDKIVTWLRDLEGEIIAEVDLVINSHGGGVDQAFHLIDMMSSTSLFINTIASGQVCSAALLIAMAGDKRYIYKNTAVLSHEYSWGSVGKHHELVAGRVMQDITQQQLLDHYQLHTGLPLKKIKKDLLTESDTWLTAQEAVALGLFDEMINKYPKPIGFEAKQKLKEQRRKEDVQRAREILKGVK